MSYRMGRGLLAFIVIACIIGGGIVTITYMNGGFDWLIQADVEEEEDDDVIIDIGEDWILSEWDGYVAKEDAVATKVSSADAFVWFDWNQDGVMQRAPFEGVYVDEDTEELILVNGEIDTLASGSDPSGYLVSGHEYPIGEYFYIQVVVSAYQTEVFKKIMFGSRNSDGTPKSIGNLLLRATDSAATDSVQATGAGVLVTDSGDYNYTTYTTSPKLTFSHTAATSDAGFSSQLHPDFGDGTYWTHWGNGKEYAGTFIGMVLTNQDATDLDPDMDYWDERIPGASNTIFLKWITDDMDGMFYASDDDGAAIFEWDFYFDIHADGDIASIGVYQDVELDDALIGIWGSNYLGTYETNLDFTA